MPVETPCIWKATSAEGVTCSAPSHSCCYRPDSPVWFVVCSGCASLPVFQLDWNCSKGQMSWRDGNWHLCYSCPACYAVPCVQAWLGVRCVIPQRAALRGCWLKLSGGKMSSREVVLAEGRSLEFACYRAVLSGLCWIIRLASWIFLMTLSSCSEQLLLSCGRGCLRFPRGGEWP